MTGTSHHRGRPTRQAFTLPTPLAENWDWQVKAACRGLSTNLFFKADDEPRSRKSGREAQAKAVCFTCPVVAECLNWALTVGETEGVWGATTADERVALQRQATG